MKNNDQYVLVTGATMGIGYELAKCFAKDGYNLVLVARTQDDLEDVQTEFKEEYGIDVITFPADLFDPENAFMLYNNISSKGIEIEILVNNAGQGQYGEFIDTDINKELSIINLNIASVVILTKKFLHDMVERGHGKILNVSSIASKSPGPFQSVYHGTKAFVQSFTEAIRTEVKDKGIVITALLPGATNTDFFNKAEMQESKIVVEGDLADPAKVAEDGYKALMKGDDMIVSGFKNKVQVSMGKLMSDSAAAEKTLKQQEPVKREK
jgi:short-subunit dehydrogenase